MIPFRAKYWIVLAEIGIAACALSAEVALWPPPDANSPAKPDSSMLSIVYQLSINFAIDSKRPARLERVK
jgi:hypothetical protein